MTLSAQNLENHINTDIETCNSLLQLMLDEREALKARDTEHLDRIIEAKVDGLQQLEQSAKQRSEWLLEGKPQQALTNEKAWLDIIQAIAPAQEANWLQLREKLKECQEQNEINGKVLTRNQQVYQRVLGILRGQPVGGGLYTQGGSKSNSQWQQSIGEA